MCKFRPLTFVSYDGIILLSAVVDLIRTREKFFVQRDFHLDMNTSIKLPVEM